MRSSRVIGFVALFVAFLGCRHVPVDKAAPVLTSSPGSAATAEQLKAGREIYVSAAKCAHCHSPKPVYEHTADDWARSILPRMAKNSKLSPDEYQNVLSYVTAGSQAQPEKASK